MNEINRDTILSILKENKKVFHDTYGVTKIGLFGSFADGSGGSGSDIDIIVEFRKEMRNIHNYFRLKRHLETEFGRDVDLGMETAIKSAVKKQILNNTVYV